MESKNYTDLNISNSNINSKVNIDYLFSYFKLVFIDFEVCFYQHPLNYNLISNY